MINFGGIPFTLAQFDLSSNMKGYASKQSYSTPAPIITLIFV